MFIAFGSCVHSIAIAFNPIARSSRVMCCLGTKPRSDVAFFRSIIRNKPRPAKDSTAQDVYDLLVKTIQTALKLSCVMLARMMN